MNEHPLIMAIAKILLGLGIIGLILWKLPVIDILYLFVMICIVPITLFYSIWGVAEGTWTIGSMALPEFKERIWAQYDKLKNEEPLNQGA